MEDKQIILTVAESYQNDVGRNVARISSSSMEKLGIKSGDIITIKGADSNQKKEILLISTIVKTTNPKVVEKKSLLKSSSFCLRHNNKKIAPQYKELVTIKSIF